ncbi:retinaldehyde-binding protein 1 [Amyelois transitella]|uniref:retinaldehyde-binding protein 1 n=1 Tax=Amyelois transitella TaxID=680683 RepID=UPI00298FE224|nr:retinaldehyde-binding protein 1 [Amyelois transitella]
MSTASVLFTVGTTWNVSSDKVDKGRLTRNGQNLAAITAETAKELRETPAIRDQTLQMMRDWIQKNGDIRNVRQDDIFLLRFLRVKKYSIPVAQQTLLKYLNLRKFYPEICQRLDWHEKKLHDLICSGYVAISPVRDSKGRRVVVYNMSKFKPNEMTCWDMCRAHAVVYESLLEDPTFQVCGVTHVGDGSGVTSGHVTSWNPTDFARIIKWGEQSLPMRHKEFHMINVPSAVKYIIDFAVSRTTPKMAARLHIHSNINDLHLNIDPSCLPVEFGGDIPMQDMISYTKHFLEEQRNTVIALQDMQLLSTRGIITSRNTRDTKDGVSTEGSFRKLEID